MDVVISEDVLSLVDVPHGQVSRGFAPSSPGGEKPRRQRVEGTHVESLLLHLVVLIIREDDGWCDAGVDRQWFRGGVISECYVQSVISHCRRHHHWTPSDDKQIPQSHQTSERLHPTHSWFQDEGVAVWRHWFLMWSLLPGDTSPNYQWPHGCYCCWSFTLLPPGSATEVLCHAKPEGSNSAYRTDS